MTHACAPLAPQLSSVYPLASAVVRLYAAGRLQPATDGRSAAGPVDLIAYLQVPMCGGGGIKEACRCVYA